MRRAVCLGGLLFFLAGCARDEDYLQVVRDQRALLKEAADILETVTDKESMAKAKVELDRVAQKAEHVSKRANALPKPPPPRLMESLQKEAKFTNTALERLTIEVQRVKKLPGGPEFWKQFTSDSQGLFSAVAP